MSVTGWAVDLGGTKTAAARIENGAITARVQSGTDGAADFAAQIARMAALLSELGFRSGDPLGVAVAGRVDATGMWQPVNAVTLPGIGAEPLGERLRDRFGPSLTLRNDAAAAALAEARLGAGRDAAHFAYLTVSTGVGGGVVLNGRLLSSRNGLAGHVGFVSSPFGEALCGSGRRGTVESVASGRAIAAAAGMENAREVFIARTPDADAAIERSAAGVARLCADLTAILGLDLIAIGGSVGMADGYLPRLAAYMQQEPPLFRVPLVLATLGHDSALLGALLPEGGGA